MIKKRKTDVNTFLNNTLYKYKYAPAIWVRSQGLRPMRLYIE